MAASSVTICNQALVAIGVDTITSLADNTIKRVRLCNTIYPCERDLLLEKFNWTGNIKRVELTAHATAPNFEYDYYYDLPSDFVRPIEVYGLTVDWKIEFGPSNKPALVTNADDDVFLIYSSTNEDVSDWIIHFNKALSLMIASQLAMPLRDSQTLADRMEARAKRAIEQAMLIDARNEKPNVNEDKIYADETAWQSEGR